MKIFIITLLAAVGFFAVVAADNKTANAWPPKVTFSEALRLAEEHIRTNKVDTSHQVLSGLAIHTSPDGGQYWQATWSKTNLWVSGGSFWVRVYMDRRVMFIREECG
jgi:hypothetical protein